MKKRLDELPEELVSNISARLHADDISSFRLTCRALEHKSLHEFGTAYFGEKCFMFTTDSLKVLVAIANSDKLKSYLQIVYFMTAFFSERAFKCPNGCNCSWQASVKQRDAFYTYIKDQKTLVRSGRAKEMLTEAFKNLTRLNALSIVDSIDSIPLDVDYRGRNKVPRLTGTMPTTTPDSATRNEYYDFVHRTWKAILDALIGSKMSTLKHLATLFAKNSFSLPIHPGLALAARPGMKTALANLNTLLLNLSTDDRFKRSGDKDIADSKARAAMAMRNLSTMLPALTSLDITFDSGPMSGLYFANLTFRLDLKKMTHFHIHTLDVSAGTLNMVIAKLTMVKDLRFTLCNLTKGSWPTVLKAIQKLTSLTHLHLMYLLEAGRKAYFLKQHERDMDPDFDDWYGEDEYSDDEDDGTDSEENSEEDDDSGDTDDDMPELESVGALGETAAVNTAQVSSSLGQNNIVGTTAIDPVVDDGHPDYPNENFTAPNSPEDGERGYFICLRGDDIAPHLTRFIAEYNLGVYPEDELPPPGGMNNFLNMLGAAIGVPPPPFGAANPAPPPPAAGTGHGGGTNPTPANGANATANTGTTGATGATTTAPDGGNQTGLPQTYATMLPDGSILGVGPIPPQLGGPGGLTTHWPVGHPPSTAPTASNQGGNAPSAVAATPNGTAPSSGTLPLPPLVPVSGGSTAATPVVPTSSTPTTISADGGSKSTSTGANAAEVSNLTLDDNSSEWEDDEED